MGNLDLKQLATDIKSWGSNLGFQQVAITNIDLSGYEPRLNFWLAEKFHGVMNYMAQHGDTRCHPEQLLSGAIRVICVRMDYDNDEPASLEPLSSKDKAYISRYARGRDYHKLIRKRLQQLATKIESVVGPFGYRAFVDSAPVLERALAEKSGLGWIGKNTMLINKQAGSWFFWASCSLIFPYRLMRGRQSIAAPAMPAWMFAQPMLLLNRIYSMPPDASPT